MWLCISDSAEPNAAARLRLRVTGSCCAGLAMSAGRRVWAGSEFTHVQGRGGGQVARLKRRIFLSKCNIDVVEPGGRRSCSSPALGGIDLENTSNQSGASAARVPQGRVFESGEWKLQPCVVGRVIRALMRGRPPSCGGTAC